MMLQPYQLFDEELNQALQVGTFPAKQGELTSSKQLMILSLA